MVTTLSHYLTPEREARSLGTSSNGRGVAAAMGQRGQWLPAVGGCSDRMDAPRFDMTHFDRRFDSRHPAISRCPINENPLNPLTLNHLPRLDLARPERSGGQSVSAVNRPKMLTINEIKRVDTTARRVDNGSLEMTPDLNK